MGLDNGVILRSNHRKITRKMLPEEMVYPWDEKFDDQEGGVEILYWRKNWGLRNIVVNTFPAYETYDYIIETPKQVFELIQIIVSFMNKEKWEEDGDSIWDYDEMLPILQQNIINLALAAAFMKNNPDVYLIFYDSY